MPVFRLDLAYDGSGFRGYAKQAGVRTVQGEMEGALRRVLGAEIRTAVAGRTDAGVHARGQVISFSTSVEVDQRRLLRSLNGLLGSEIAVHRLVAVDDSFHARFSATSRTYRYRTLLAQTLDPLTRNFVWHMDTDVDVALIHKTSAFFIGEHDFGSFCRSVPGKSTIRRVSRSEWLGAGDELDFWITANAFCHQMVRSLVGLCYDVARGHIGADDVPEIMERGHRTGVAPVGTVAPPHGLTLWEVGY